MAKISFDNVRKKFGNLVAVQDNSFTIEDGEFFVLLGPSGCGKSTTMRLISGLEDVTEGTIRIGDEVVNGIPASKRNIAMAFQEIALYPHMTVFENISSPLRAEGRPKEEIRPRVENTAQMLEIEELLDRDPGELSGGQRQRVAIGRAVVREPRAFLLDEPFSSLDQMLRIELQKELQRLQDKTDVTTVFVTHDQEEAMVLADRIAVMKNGGIQQIGTPRDIYRRPSNTFVADFIGNPSMNFFDMSVEGGELLIGGVVYDDIEGRSLDTATTMAARPEDIRPIINESDRERLVANVELVEMHGGTTYIICKLGEKEITIEKPRDYDVKEGDQIALDFNFSGVNFFDKNGESINEQQSAQYPEQIDQ